MVLEMQRMEEVNIIAADRLKEILMDQLLGVAWQQSAAVCYDTYTLCSTVHIGQLCTLIKCLYRIIR